MSIITELARRANADEDGTHKPIYVTPQEYYEYEAWLDARPPVWDEETETWVTLIPFVGENCRLLFMGREVTPR